MTVMPIDRALLEKMSSRGCAKLYCGLRWEGGRRISVRVADAVTRTVYDLRNVIPAGGFDWGYGGSAPENLALSIVADWVGENPTPETINWGCRSWRWHVLFKNRLISSAPRDRFVILVNEAGVFYREDDPTRIIVIDRTIHS